MESLKRFNILLSNSLPRLASQKVKGGNGRKRGMRYRRARIAEEVNHNGGERSIAPRCRGQSCSRETPPVFSRNPYKYRSTSRFLFRRRAISMNNNAKTLSLSNLIPSFLRTANNYYFLIETSYLSQTKFITYFYLRFTLQIFQ